jgi:predicted ATP-dependent endonuclease of OLD family
LLKPWQPAFEFRSWFGNLFTGPKRLVFSETKIEVALPDGESIGLAGLSSGEKHLLRILVDVMQAGPNSVLIDEPEISMHVDWQTNFIELVRSLNPDCQLVLATHSPEIVSNLPDTDLFRL